jgi:hypothetical protein
VVIASVIPYPLIVVGFDVNKGSDVITNCTDEQVVLLLELFEKEYEFRKPSAEL